MECRGWCAFGGTLLMVPLLRTVERSAPQQVSEAMPWWVWLLLFLLALLAIGWWVLSLRPGSRREVQELEAQLEHEHGAHEPHGAAPHDEAAAPPIAEKPPERDEPEVEQLADPQAGEFGEVVADDLTLIEGIGPKIASVLYEVGVRTYAQLAEADIQELQALLQANGLQMHDPASWPQQAALARDGENEKLRALQERLKGGREDGA